MKVRLAVWAVAAVVFAIDYTTKLWAIHALSDGHSIEIIGSHLTLKLVYNEGAALSILGNFGIGITIVMLLVIIVLLWFHGRTASLYSIVVFGLALGGAVGNFYDRMIRGLGWGRGPVVDMIKYGDFFIGNVADIAIVCAAAATIAASWMRLPMLKPRKADAGNGSGDGKAGESSGD
jgi:signal peptidase II